MSLQPLDESIILQRVDELNDRLWRYRNMPVDNDDPELALKEVDEKCRLVNYPLGSARALLNVAMSTFIVKHEPDKAFAQLNEALELFKQLNDKKWLANTYMTLSILNNTLVKTELAMYNGLKGIDFFDNGGGNVFDRSMAFYIMGTVYKDLKQFHEAELYYRKGLEREDMVSMWIGRIYAGLTSIYTLQERYPEAVEASLKGLRILRDERNNIGESRVLNDIGMIYRKQKDYENALLYFSQALTMRMDTKARQFALVSLMDMADTYFEIGNLASALQHLEQAVEIALEVKATAKLATIYKQAGEILKASGRYSEAYDYLEKYVQLKVEQSEKDVEGRLTQLKNAVIEEKENEIEYLKNVELKNAYHIISEKNKEVTDSINYALRIQHSLIMQSHSLISAMPESFIFFRPKDIVSGDFYWAAYSEKQLMYLAVCDSTGHGVPGAFMSLLNISFLNEAIKEQHIAYPNEVLNHVRQRLIESLSQDGGKDGMDAILVCYDQRNQTLTYSAANNSPLLIKKDGTRLYLPCDKMPVGKGERDDSFTLHSIRPEPGDTLYLYTDGYADQFGGEKGKKFKYRQLEELLQSASLLSPEEQKTLIETTFDAWKGELEQVDDVCIIGIKL